MFYLRHTILLAIFISVSLLACAPFNHEHTGLTNHEHPKGVAAEQLPKAENVEPVSQLAKSVDRPKYKLWINESSKVYRNAFDDELKWNIAWVILYNGNEVLSRNASNETSYNYFRNDPGTYTIYLEAWLGDGYEVVSNVVSYSIPE